MDGQCLGSLALTRSGMLLVAVDLGLHIFDPETGALTAISAVEPGMDNRLGIDTLTR